MMSDSGKILLPKAVKGNHQLAEKPPRDSYKPMLSCGAELRTLPAAFSLVETMKESGNQMATGTCTYTCGMAPVSLGDNDSDA
ncbi:hypothetical protein ABFA07_001544 [Porites harrisoni]